MTGVPAGAEAITVLVCDAATGCPDAEDALSQHYRALDLPWMRLRDVVAAGPGGDDALRDWQAARGGLGETSTPAALLAALDALPLALPQDTLFQVFLELAAHHHAAGQPDAASAMLHRAATVSDGRVVDLPMLPSGLRDAYLDLATAPVDAPLSLQIAVPGPGRLTLDGRPIAAEVVVSVRPGWHRLAFEATGRQAAWVGVVEAGPGRVLALTVPAQADDRPEAVAAALLGTVRGTPAPQGVADDLCAWADAQGLRHVRFVALAPEAEAPQEWVPDPDPDRPPWALDAATLDVASCRLAPGGASPAAMALAAGPARVQVGVALGTLFLAPRHHALLELQASLQLRPLVAVEGRAGLIRTGSPYYLYPGWVDGQLYPVSVGARVGRVLRGPQASVSVLGVVPYALGVQATAGWTLAPAGPWRVTLETRGGITDQGWLAGGSLGLARVQR